MAMPYLLSIHRYSIAQTHIGFFHGIGTMTEAHKPQPTITQVATWLATRHAGEIVDIAPLSGGFWSSAFSYRVGSDEFVLRLSDMSEGFVIDAAAMRFTSPA